MGRPVSYTHLEVNHLFDIQEELKKLPAKPGVYIMQDAWDTIIYVGKAISLKNRVRQYFQSSRNKGPKIEQMEMCIRDRALRTGLKCTDPLKILSGSLSPNPRVLGSPFCPV